jgi:hypothetical protein
MSETGPQTPTPVQPDADMFARQLADVSSRLAQIEAKVSAPAPANGLTNKEIRDELDFVTSRMSELTRYVAFGLAALFFVLLSSSSEFAKVIMQKHGGFILGVSAAGCIAIVADYLQYLYGQLDSHRVLDEVSPDGLHRYNENHPLFRRRVFFYRAKQFFAALGVVSLAGLLIYVYAFKELVAARDCPGPKPALSTSASTRETPPSQNGC